MNLSAIPSYIAAVSSIILGLIVLHGDPRSFLHRVFAAGMCLLGLEAGVAGLGLQSTSLAEVMSWQHLKIILTSLLPGIWLLFSLSFARVNYLEFLFKWKWAIMACFLFPLLIILFFKSAILGENPLFDGSLGLFFRLGWAGYLLYLFYLIGAVLILMNLERTFRHSIGHARWQIKFMVLGVGGIFAARIYTDSQVILYQLIQADLEIVNVGTLLLANCLIASSLWRVKILKFDFYFSHSILYHSFTVLLVGIYFIAVGVVARLLFYLRGAQSPAVTALLVFVGILILAIFLLSDRLRLLRKRFISRHFKRPRYDYPRVWAHFTEKTASLTDIKRLCDNIVRMVSETFEALSVSIWLVDEQEERLWFGGSTDLSEGQTPNLKIAREGSNELIRTMVYHPFPLDLKKSGDDWVEDLKGSCGEAFREARINLCVPMSAAGRLVGILTLGGKVSNEPYSFEDLELLKTIADQAAANVLTLRLGERLQQAKEMEAFQLMSAFFIHDLKNLASRLSLVTQNLPVHFHDPEFRNDALKTISQSLDKINGMCGRLSLLSQKIQLHPQEGNINELVQNTLGNLDGLLNGSLALDLQPLPKLILDPDQIQKVVTNLILNAHEAVQSGGSIKISTGVRGNCAVLSIADNGCGMSPEFIGRSLFRPFHTTKKQGMGIGLFHSKKIIEAHQGRIEVESEEGKGTTFRVLLPIKAGGRG